MRGWGLTRRCLVHRHRSLSLVSGQQLVDFLIFKSHLDFSYTVDAQNIFCRCWSIATVNLSTSGKQQLVDFQIFKGRCETVTRGYVSVALLSCHTCRTCSTCSCGHAWATT